MEELLGYESIDDCDIKIKVFCSESDEVNKVLCTFFFCVLCYRVDNVIKNSNNSLTAVEDAVDYSMFYA